MSSLAPVRAVGNLRFTSTGVYAEYLVSGVPFVFLSEEWQNLVAAEHTELWRALPSGGTIGGVARAGAGPPPGPQNPFTHPRPRAPQDPLPPPRPARRPQSRPGRDPPGVHPVGAALPQLGAHLDPPPAPPADLLADSAVGLRAHRPHPRRQLA